MIMKTLLSTCLALALLSTPVASLWAEDLPTNTPANLPPPPATVSEAAASNASPNLGTSVQTNVSSSVTEVIKLVNSGVPDELVHTYIENSQAPFNITPDNIIYLNSLHLPANTITAMMQHDRALREKSDSYLNAQNNSPAPQSPAPAPDANNQASQPPPPVADNGASSQYVPSTDETASPQTIEYFNETLTPYGTWSDVPGFGRCWQPTVARGDHSWRPYCDKGQWFYTDAGWYWNSYYPWGWAPFHYGRWTNHPERGWIWKPGKTWSPAWVTWRCSDKTMGWAAMPAGSSFDAKSGFEFDHRHVPPNFNFNLKPADFTFVSAQNFAAMDLIPFRFDAARASQAFADTQVINNFGTGPNGTVFNGGLDVHQVAAISKTPIVRARIEDSKSLADVGFTPGNEAAAPSIVRIFRPQVTASTSPLLSVPPTATVRTPTSQPAQNPAATSVYPFTYSTSNTPGTANSTIPGQLPPTHPLPAIAPGTVTPPLAPAGTTVSTNGVQFVVPPASVGGGNVVPGGTGSGSGHHQ